MLVCPPRSDLCTGGEAMEADEKDNNSSNAKRAKAEWNTPVLAACGNMMNVLADSGFGSDGTATGSQFSS